MNGDLTTAVNLMVIGMITVAIILLLVVLTARLLIKLINKYGPAPVLKEKKTSQTTSTIDAKQLAVLAAVVEHITGGKGVIKEITKGN